ncbi:MAG: alpha-glucosidase [Bacillota bacterium]|nr:alpha-glucosidase [Bacillota bacterium]
MKQNWWKEAIVYQIYPRSFCDSNGDGIGDLRGIISKLDYLKDLGVNVIWLCPVYKSPNDDNGYDISDYYDIMDEFGTLADWEEMLNEIHKRGMKLIMDLVVNHSSDEHKWFQESRNSKNNEKRDYYIWEKGKDGREPNNWASFFTPSVWEYDDKTGEYYLHLFSKKQPDLNWENPKLRSDVFSMMEWWLQKGIDGFRMDVINCISKAEGYPAVPAQDSGYKWGGKYFINGPRVHEYLQEMNRKVLSKYDIMTVGETPDVNVDDAALYTAEERNELNMVFQFELMGIDSGDSGKWELKPWKLTDFKNIIKKWQHGLENKGWNSLFLNNHDQPRMVSRFGDDKKYRNESAKMLGTLVHTLQGTPYIYQGEEIGMTNIKYKSIEEYKDIETINFYNEAIKCGDKSLDEIMESIYSKGRDNARTPMQWNDEENAGFTSGEPWIEVNPNYKEINVNKEEKYKDSVLNYYKKLIKIRKENPVIIYGRYIPLMEQDEEVFSYIRELGNEKILVILNFKGKEADFNLPEGIEVKEDGLLISNYENHSERLKPYEARVYKI